MCNIMHLSSKKEKASYKYTRFHESFGKSLKKIGHQ